MLLKRRLGQGVSQSELARRFGIDRTTLFRLLPGLLWCLRLAGYVPCNHSRAEESKVPGHQATDNQMRSFMNHRKSHSTEAAAAKAGCSARSGYRIKRDPTLPSQKKAPRGRRRPDPLAGIFEEEVVPTLEGDSGIRALNGNVGHIRAAGADVALVAE